MPLTSRQKEIIRLLKLNNSWMKGESLADILKVTVRTIRNDIRNMKKDNIILSSKNGYKLNDKCNLDKYFDSEVTPITPEERVSYILNKLLNSNKPIDMLDVADDIFVSDATLKKDLKKIRSLINDYKLVLKKDLNMISIEGNEKNKRKLITDIIYNEANNNFLNINNNKSFLKDYNFNHIKTIIFDVLKSCNIYSNDYSVTSLALHITILMERITNNCTLNTDEYSSFEYESYYEYGIAIKIVNELEKNYNIKFPPQETCYITFLLMGKTTINYSTINMQNLGDFIEEYYIELVKKIIDKTDNYYHLKLNDEEFFIKFVIHIKNLLLRAKNGVYSRNPLNKSIKLEYPFIYDIAVYISNEIYNETKLKINDDEIGYIALYISVAIEKSKILGKKIKTAIICPRYYDMHLRIIEKLMNRYSDDIEITDVITSLGYLTDFSKVDLIISTLSPDENIKIPWIKIDPLLSNDNYIKIDQSIQKINEYKNKSIVRQAVIKCFDRELFSKNIYFKDEFDTIQYMGKKVVRKGLVNEDFIESAIKREKLSSTAFGYNFAIPHALDMTAKRTVISVLINDKPIKWGENYVQLVFLISVNKKDRNDFMKLYDSIISILSKEENVKLLVKSNNYEDFIDYILQLFQSETSE